MLKMNMCPRVLGTVAGLALSTGVLAQGIGPSYGTVEFRWRERSTPGYNGMYTLGPGAVAGIDAVPTPSPSAASVTAQDASVVLVLEAKVTNSPGAPGTPGRGLLAAEFDVLTNRTTGGAFARQNYSQPPGATPRANARIDALNLGFDPSTLVNFPTSGIPRAVVPPFRAWADDDGPSSNQPDIGVVSTDLNKIRGIAASLQREFFTPGYPDATNPGEYNLAGLDEWVAIYVAIYTITDVTTPRDIVFTIGQPFGQNAGLDYALRTWRGQTNPLNGGSDSWQMSSAPGTPPTFTVRVVPGPGAVGVLALGCGGALRRRRR